MSDDSSQPPDATGPDDDRTGRVPDRPGSEPVAADLGDAPAADVEGEPQRFRVADTGWPPPSGSVGPALPRRTPGATGGPGGASPSAEDPAEELAPAAAPAAVRAGWVTSPPLADEPWAGLPPAARDATAPESAAPAAESSGAAMGETAAGPDVPPAEVDGEAGVAPASGRHRGAKARHGRPRRRGSGHRTGDVADPASDTAEVDAAPLLPSTADGTDASGKAEVPVGAADDRDIGDRGDPATSGPRPARSHASRARPRAGRLAPTWPAARLALLSLAVVAALVFGVLTLVTRVWPGPAGNPYTSASTKAAIAAATAVAPPILSYNYTTIDQKAAQLAPLQTAACATQYQQLITTTVKPLAVQNKATQQAAVLAAGVTSASKNAVTVLAFMQLTSTNSVKKGQEINEAQISVSMVRQHGRWLLAGTSANGSGSVGHPSCGGANPTSK